MAVNILEFKDLADGEDFQPAFRAALDEVIRQGGGELVIPMPAGTDTYWIGRRESVDRPLAPDSGLDFTGVNVPIKIRGEGRRPRIGMLPPVDDSGSLDPTGDFYMFHFKQTDGSISLDNLCLFGNKEEFPADDPADRKQRHLVQISHARDISFTNVWFEESPGDAIKMVGDLDVDPGAGVELEENDRIKITGCHFLHNRRGGVLFQRVARRIFLTHNYFDGGGDNSIDFEPSGGLGFGAAEQIVVAYNHIRNRHFDRTRDEWVLNRGPAMTLSDGHKLAVIGNFIEGGTIFGKNVQEASIIGNHIDGGDSLRAGIYFQRAARDIAILGNWVRVTIAEPAVKLDFDEVLAPENVIIANNPHLEGFTGVNVVRGRRIKIHDNLIFGNSHSASGGVGVNINAHTDKIDGINIHDNDIKGFEFGVQLARREPGTIKARVRSNDIEDFTGADYKWLETESIKVDFVP
jgi:hypothetical protein